MVILDGRRLTSDALMRVACSRERVRISPRQWPAIRASARFVARHAVSSAPIYGINTGFGALADVKIAPRDLRNLQTNIIRSHHAGVGEPFAPELVRAAMAIRLNSLVRGFSGVSELCLRRLCAFLNHDIVPVVPRKGSVGASGDLAPMAAIGMALLGEGEVWFRGRRMHSRRALHAVNLAPWRPGPKEGLALLNGTQFSTAIAAYVHDRGHRLTAAADLCGALSVEALRGSATPFDDRITRVRPHAGARLSARRIRRLLAGSAILRSHEKCAKVQDAYSLRCMAQVHGAVQDLFASTRRTLQIELNSVTDNPLIFAADDEALSGGNFHAEPIAFTLDMMAIGLAELASISERRVFRMLDPKLSDLKPFLAHDPGLNSGFMMAQVTAAALVAQNKTLCHPASVDSIPTSANQEDHVSMSMNAGLKALEVLENTEYVLGIELLCACQALDLLRPLRSSARIESIKRAFRADIPFLTKDAPLAPLIERSRRFITALSASAEVVSSRAR